MDVWEAGALTRKWRRKNPLRWGFRAAESAWVDGEVDDVVVVDVVVGEDDFELPTRREKKTQVKPRRE